VGELIVPNVDLKGHRWLWPRLQNRPVFAHSAPTRNVTAIDFARLARFCCSYLEMAKTVFIAGTTACWDDLFERLASLPRADQASFETAQLAFTPGSELVLNLWGENLRCWRRQPLSWRAARASHRSCQADDVFELARFDREPTNMTESLIIPTAPWTASSMGGGLGADEGVGAISTTISVVPADGHCCLQIQADDPNWAGFRIDLVRDATGKQLDPVLADLAVDWYGRFGLALRSG